MNARPSFWRASRTSAPPTQALLQRNEAILALCVLLLLAAGWGVRRAALGAATRSAELGSGLPALTYPSAWLPVSRAPGGASADAASAASEEMLLFQARNPATAGGLDATVRVSTLPVRADDTLDTLRVRLGFSRAQALDRYRELAAEPVAVLGGRPALLATYAYLADPTRAGGGYGLPVVVEAQELIFQHENRWLLYTLAADAAHFDAAAADFAAMTQDLGLERSAP